MVATQLPALDMTTVVMKPNDDPPAHRPSSRVAE